MGPAREEGEEEAGLEKTVPKRKAFSVEFKHGVVSSISTQSSAVLACSLAREEEVGLEKTVPKRKAFPVEFKHGVVVEKGGHKR